MIDYVPNLLHVPGSMLFSGADELVQVPSSTAMQRAFAATGNTYTWYMHPVADHFTYALADDWTKEAADSRGKRLVRDPARVLFRTDPQLDAPQYGIYHDRAYWVSGLRDRTAGPLTVDLTSAARGIPMQMLATSHGTGTAPVPWLSIAQAPTAERTSSAEQLLTGTLTNVSAVSVDLTAAGLQHGAAFRIASDGPALLHVGASVVRLVAGTNAGRLP
ncbi:MAG: hypothetical protein NVS3B26_31050 [Mycobacteriales bacterium]